MRTEEKLRFVLSTIGPMARHTFPYLAQIFGGNSPERAEPLGTGVYCQFDGRRTLVTAGHVFHDGLAEFDYLAASTHAEDKRPFLIHGSWRQSQVTDLAILDLPEDFPSSDELLFWPEERIDRENDLLSTDFLFLHGFPGVRSRSISIPIDSRVSGRSLPYGVMQRLDDLPEGMETHQFAMDFDIARCQAEQGDPEKRLFEAVRRPERPERQPGLANRGQRASGDRMVTSVVPTRRRRHALESRSQSLDRDEGVENSRNRGDRAQHNNLSIVHRSSCSPDSAPDPPQRRHGRPGHPDRRRRDRHVGASSRATAPRCPSRPANRPSSNYSPSTAAS